MKTSCGAWRQLRRQSSRTVEKKIPVVHAAPPEAAMAFV